MLPLILGYVLLLIATVIGLNDRHQEFKERQRDAEEKPTIRSRREARPSGKRHKLMIGLMLLSLLLSGYYLYDDYTDKTKLLERSKKTLERVEVVLNASNRILSNTDTSLNRLEDLQDSASKLNDSLSGELRIQRATNGLAMEILVRSERVAKLLIADSSEKFKSSLEDVYATVKDVKPRLMYYVGSREFDSAYLVSDTHFKTLMFLMDYAQSKMSPLSNSMYLSSQPALQKLWIEYVRILNSLIMRLTPGGDDYDPNQSLYIKRLNLWSDFKNAYYKFRDYFFGTHYLDGKNPPEFEYWFDIGKRQSDYFKGK